MKRFEYQVLTYPMVKRGSFQKMQDDLNRLGADGWEAISASSSDYTDVGHTVFLKRQIEETD